MTNGHQYLGDYLAGEDLNDIDLYRLIADLEGTLRAGETTTSIDGTTSTIDLDVIRRERDILVRRRDELLNRVPKKPRVATIDVGCLF